MRITNNYMKGFPAPEPESTTTAFFYSSGCFVHQPQPWQIGKYSLTPPATNLFNLATEPTEKVISLTRVPLEDVVTEISEIAGEKVAPADVKKFTSEDINSYQDNLIAVAVDLEKFLPAVVLVPLRGGLKPRQIVDGLLNHALPFEEFGFTQKSDPLLAKQFQNELRGILAGYSSKNRDLRIGVLDAGIGGDSSNILAKWLIQIHEELGGLWKVQFHILHEPDRPARNFSAVENKRHPGIRFKMKTHIVSSLLVEDWSPGIGLRTERKGESLTYKKSIRPGAIFVTRDDGTCFLSVSEDACRAVNKTISILGTDRMHETLRRTPKHDDLGDYAKRFK